MIHFRRWLTKRLTNMTPFDISQLQLMAAHNASYLLQQKAEGKYVPTRQIYKAKRLRELISETAPHLAKITFYENDASSYVN